MSQVRRTLHFARSARRGEDLFLLPSSRVSRKNAAFASLDSRSAVMRELTFHGNLSLFSEVKNRCFSNKTVFHAIVGLARGANVFKSRRFT